MKWGNCVNTRYLRANLKDVRRQNKEHENEIEEQRGQATNT